MSKEPTWRKAITQILTESGGSMHYRAIADEIVSSGLRTNVGATPAATVAAQLSSSLKKLGSKSPFVKVGTGEYALRSFVSDTGIAEEEETTTDSELQYEVVTSFGVFWRRDLVQWTKSCKIRGIQQLGAEPVDFYGQLGVYLLYDGREVIYVGRSSERPIGQRLYEHTKDRLSARWDRFSWFGLLPVTEMGNLTEPPSHYDSRKLIPALEAILIEALEPRQNRKRGDDLSAVEFLQGEDPEIKKQKVKETLAAALDRL